MSTMNSARLDMAFAWSQKNPRTGFYSPRDLNGLRVSVAPTAGSAGLAEVYYVEGTLSVGASITFNLNSIVAPAFGNTIVGTGVYVVLLQGTGASWKFDPGTSDQCTWFFGGATQSINGGDGAAFGFGDRTPGTVNASTKNLRITHTGVSGTLTYQIAIGLKTAP